MTSTTVMYEYKPGLRPHVYIIPLLQDLYGPAQRELGEEARGCVPRYIMGVDIRVDRGEVPAEKRDLYQQQGTSVSVVMADSTAKKHEVFAAVFQLLHGKGLIYPHVQIAGVVAKHPPPYAKDWRAPR